MPVTHQDVAQRLRVAREAIGLTQDEVARALGIARTAVVQMERGGRSVSSIELAKLADLYRRDIRSFVEDERSGTRTMVALFRSFADGAGEAEAAAMQECLVLGRAVTELERLVGLDRRMAETVNYALPSPRSRMEAVRQGANVAAQERFRLGIGDTPISGLAELLERQGIRTASIPLPRDVAGLTVIDAEIGALVVVNENEAFVRRRFSFAHEYAHVLLDADAGAVVTRDSGREDLREVRANAFAANLLLPDGGIRRHLATAGKDGGGRLIPASVDDEWHSPVEARDSQPRDIRMHDVVELAARFGVSRHVAVYRMRNAGVLKDVELQNLLEQEREGNGRRLARLLGEGEDDESPSAKPVAARLLRLAVEALSRGVIDADRFKDLLRLLPDSQSISPALDELLSDVGLISRPWQLGKATPRSSTRG